MASDSSHDGESEFRSLEGESLDGIYLEAIQHPLVNELDLLIGSGLLPEEHDLAFFGHDTHGNPLEVIFPVEPDEASPNKKKIAYASAAGVAALGTMAAIGYRLYKKGIIGPKRREQ